MNDYFGYSNASITVLISGMGSTTAISVAKGLRHQTELPVRIVGVDTHESVQVAGSKFCDRFYRVPRADAPDYIDVLLAICKREQVRILLPIVDLELEYISESIEKFRGADVMVWISSHETIMICNDKWRTYEFFQSNHIPTALTWNQQSAMEKAETLPYPLIVKPAKGVSSRDVFRVHSPEELASAIRHVAQPVVQEVLQGQEYTIDVFCDQSGRALAAVPRIRLETRSGISYKGITVRDATLIEAGMRIAELLQIRGHCNIQCFKKDETAARFIEVNPRFSGSLPLTIRAGLNSPLLALMLSTGKPISPDRLRFKENLVMLRYWEEHFVQM
jgi:carbamoyl-phosphate synthase large subunit